MAKSPKGIAAITQKGVLRGSPRFNIVKYMSKPEDNKKVSTFAAKIIRQIETPEVSENSVA